MPSYNVCFSYHLGILPFVLQAALWCACSWRSPLARSDSQEAPPRGRPVHAKQSPEHQQQKISPITYEPLNAQRWNACIVNGCMLLPLTSSLRTLLSVDSLSSTLLSKCWVTFPAFWTSQWATSLLRTLSARERRSISSIAAMRCPSWRHKKRASHFPPVFSRAGNASFKFSR